MLLALAFAAGDEAVRLSHHPDTQKTFEDYHTKTGARYLRFIEKAGYQLTEVEAELCACHEQERQKPELYGSETAALADETDEEEVDWDAVNADLECLEVVEVEECE